MSLTPDKLRAAAQLGRERGGAQWAPVAAEDADMLADAMEIADSCARADIESYCTARGEGEDYRTWWWDTSSAKDEDEASVVQALRYCEARGLIERHPTDAPLVRFKEPA